MKPLHEKALNAQVDEINNIVYHGQHTTPFVGNERQKEHVKEGMSTRLEIMNFIIFLVDFEIIASTRSTYSK